LIRVSKNGKPVDVKDQPFNNEEELRKSLLSNLNIIPVEEISDGEDKVIVAWRTEFPLGDFGSVDILCVGDGGGIYLIETKLFQNTDRRRIIAQVLDYSTGLWKYYGYDPDDFLEKLMENGCGEIPEDEIFYEKIRDSLRSGNYKILIAMDSITEQVKNLIEFLNKHTNIKFLALELKRYVGDGLEIIIPYIYGKEITREPLPPQPPVWTHEKLKQEFEKISDSPLRERLMKILDLALRKNAFDPSRAKIPQFSIKHVGGKILNFDINGSIYAFFGVNEIRKFPSNEDRYRFVEKLKALGLLPKDINPDDIKSGKILTKRLNDLRDDEFTQLINLIQEVLTNPAYSNSDNRRNRADHL